MLDVAWPEVLVIGVVALVAIGPKDLPKVMYQLGRWSGKARRFGDAFRHALDEARFEAEVASRLEEQSQMTKDTPIEEPPKPRTTTVHKEGGGPGEGLSP